MSKFLIADIFTITGRGLVFAGHLIDGIISPGDIIEFDAFSLVRCRKIISIEGIRNTKADEITLGLLIECENDTEINELKNWKPNNQQALLFKSDPIELPQI